MPQANYFDQFDTAPQAAPQSAPTYPGVIMGRPDPTKAAEEARKNRDEARKDAEYNLSLSRDQREQDKAAQEQADKQGKVDNTKSSAVSEILRIIGAIDDAALLTANENGWWMTGHSGAAVRTLPNVMQAGSSSKALEGYLATINANTAFSKLQDMRQNSPTGGAVGAVSDSDMRLLQSTISSIDPDQDQTTFLNNLAKNKRAYLEMLGKLDPDAAKQVGGKPGIRYNQDGSAYLSPMQGEDKRQQSDPFGIAGANGPQGPDSPPQGPSGGSDTWFAGIPGLEGNYSPESLWKGIKTGVGDVVQGVGDTLGIIGNPLNATINAATGSHLSTNLGETARQATGIEHGNRPIVEAINRGGASALSGAGIARAAIPLAASAPVRGALSQYAATPVRDVAAGAAAGTSGEIAKENGAGTVGQIAASVLGGMAGYGGASALAAAGAPKAPSALLAAADRQNVDLLPADTGGAVAKGVTTATKASPLSVAPVVAAAKRTNQQIADAAGRLVEGQGGTVNSEVAGNNVRDAALRFTKQSAERGSRLYDKAYTASQGVKIKPLKTVNAIDEQIARLSENPAENGSLINQLNAFKENISKGVSVQGLRDARTQLSQGVFDGKLRSGTEQAMWKQVLGNIADDIDGGLQQAGRGDTAAKFRAADKFWADRVEHIDKALEPLIGKDKSGEQIVQTIESMTRGGGGGNARLSRVMSQMTDQEAGNVRATVIDRMGRASAGQQNAEGDAFSAATFLTNWSKMTPQAKATVFGDGKLRSSLNDIARIAEATKAAQALANHSNTGIAIGGNVGVGSALAVTHPVAALFGAGSQYLTGKLMASPRFARMLASTARMPERQAQRSLMEQVGVIATREPALRQDAIGLQNYLQTAFGQSPVRAAASDKEAERRRVPPAQ